MTLITRQLSRSGARFAYREHGSGAPVVLIHGVGMQSAAWAPQIPALAAKHRVIAIDLPGHGGSDPLPVAAGLGDFVAWCEDAIRTLELGRINIVGHSMGALIVGGLAVTFPELVQRVALLNGVYRRDEQARAAVMARAAHIRAGKIDLDAPLDRWFADTPVERHARDLTASWLRDVDPMGYATAYTAFAQGDATYAKRLEGVACPLLALTGADDPNSTPKMARQIAAITRNGRAVVIEGQRHMVNLTEPEQVNAHLLDWLRLPLMAEVSK